MMRIANPDFAQTVAASFQRQNAMRLIRATLARVEYGRAEIHAPHWEGVEQQHGFVHGGVVGMIADSSAGYAAMTVAPAGATVIAVEYHGRIQDEPGGARGWRETDRPRRGRPTRPNADRDPSGGIRPRGKGKERFAPSCNRPSWSCTRRPRSSVSP